MNPIEELRQEIRDIPEIVLSMLEGQSQAEQEVFSDIQDILEPEEIAWIGPPPISQSPDFDLDVDPPTPFLDLDVDPPTPFLDLDVDPPTPFLDLDVDPPTPFLDLDVDPPTPFLDLDVDPPSPDFELDVDDWPGTPPIAREDSPEFELMEDAADFPLPANDQHDMMARIVDAVEEILTILRDKQTEPAQAGTQAVDQPNVIRWDLHDEGGAGPFDTSALAVPGPEMGAPARRRMQQDFEDDAE